MPKLKTKKALSKKVKVTRTGKVLRRHTKQNHFNSKQTGNFKRKKRRDLSVFSADAKNMKKALNY